MNITYEANASLSPRGKNLSPIRFPRHLKTGIGLLFFSDFSIHHHSRVNHHLKQLASLMPSSTYNDINFFSPGSAA